MAVETVKLDIPEFVYLRLENTAKAMRRSVEDVMLYALKVGSPPTTTNKIGRLTPKSRLSG